MAVGLVALAGLLALVGTVVSDAATGGQRGAEVLPGGHKVVTCHAANNSFTRIEVDVNSIVKGTGHGGHANDIIPPFDYRLSPKEEVQRYPGRNWDERGQEIWANGCSRPQPPHGTIEVFACVEVNGPTFNATFGYNSNAGRIAIPAGPDNGFSPTPVDRGQVTTFSDGYVLAAFAVKDITEPALTWTVRHNDRSSSVTVSRQSAPCSIPPEPPPPETDIPIGVFLTCVSDHGSSFDAVFGYDNENPDPVTIPTGAANRFSPAPGDRGQPTTFKPGHFGEAIRVTGIPSSSELTWTLAFTDTRTATATADFDVKCGEPPAPRPFGIFATCATRHSSSFDAVFGYVNENVGTLQIPKGPRNSISPGPVDRGQPESFAPGFVDAAFAVSDVPISDSVTWRVKLDDDEVRVAIATSGLPDCLTTPIDPVSKAAISKTAAPLTAVVGERFRSTFVLRNHGSAVMRPAAVRDFQQGARLRILSVSATRGRCHGSAGAQAIQCRAATLAPGASLRVRIDARATAAGTARDRAVFVGRPKDRTPRDNAGTAAVQILPARPPGLG